MKKQEISNASIDGAIFITFWLRPKRKPSASRCVNALSSQPVESEVTDAAGAAVNTGASTKPAVRRKEELFGLDKSS